jgi:hypothetical protein
MRVRRDRVDQLAVVEQGHHEAGRDAGQRPVVGAAATPQPHAGPVHRHGRDDHQLGRRHRGHPEPGPGRLAQAQRPGHQGIGSGVDTPVQVPVVPEHGQQYPPGDRGQRVDEPRAGRLARQGDVGGHRRGAQTHGRTHSVGDQGGVGSAPRTRRDRGPRGQQPGPHTSLGNHRLMFAERPSTAACATDDGGSRPPPRCRGG